MEINVTSIRPSRPAGSSKRQDTHQGRPGQEKGAQNKASHPSHHCSLFFTRQCLQIETQTKQTTVN